MFLKNYWYIAAMRSEIKDRPMRRIFLEQPVVLYRTPGNEVVALEDRCIHRGVPLSKGELLPDGGLRCIYHGMEFEPSGKCRFIPEQTKIPPRACVKSYPLVERYEWVWIWMGDPALADPSKIPSYPWFDMPGWKTRIGRLEVKCNYEPIVENLLNMAHLPYVHPHTIGSEGVIKDAQVSVTRTGHSVLLARKMYNIEPPPTYKEAGGFDGNVNRWQNIEFRAPSFLEFDTGVIEATYPIPDGSNAGAIEGARILARHAAHGITPETEKTSHYYFGFSFNPAEITDEIADFIFASSMKTFLEDVDILEAQQMNMDLMPDAPTLDIVSDAAGRQAMRVIDELERAQAPDSASMSHAG